MLLVVLVLMVMVVLTVMVVVVVMVVARNSIISRYHNLGFQTSDNVCPQTVIFKHYFSPHKTGLKWRVLRSLLIRNETLPDEK